MIDEYDEGQGQTFGSKRDRPKPIKIVAKGTYLGRQAVLTDTGEVLLKVRSDLRPNAHKDFKRMPYRK